MHEQLGGMKIWQEDWIPSPRLGPGHRRQRGEGDRFADPRGPYSLSTLPHPFCENHLLLGGEPGEGLLAPAL